MKEPRQANCSFITYFPGQTGSAVFSLKNKRKKQPQKTAKKPFHFLTQQRCCLSSGTPGVLPECRGTVLALAVSPGALCGLSPMLACPHRPRHCCHAVFDTCEVSSSHIHCWHAGCSQGLVPVVCCSSVQKLGFD